MLKMACAQKWKPISSVYTEGNLTEESRLPLRQSRLLETHILCAKKQSITNQFLPNQNTKGSLSPIAPLQIRLPPPPFALAPYPIIKLQLYQLLSTMKCLPYTINLFKVICHILSIFLHVFLHEKKLQIGRDVSDVSTNYPTVHLGTCNQSTSRISRPGQRLGLGQS